MRVGGREDVEKAIRLLFAMPCAFIGGFVFASQFKKSGALQFALGGGIGGAVGALLGEGAVRLLNLIAPRDDSRSRK